MVSNLLVLKENRYSFSPIINIADFFSSKIEIIYLKDLLLKENQRYEENLIFSSFENQLKNFQISNDLNLFFFSVHSLYRKFFLILLKYLKEKFSDSLFIAGGPDVIAEPKLYANYFDFVCNSEGESFLIDLFSSLSIFDSPIEKEKENIKVEILPDKISNCISRFSSIQIIKNSSKIKILRGPSSSLIVCEKSDINDKKRFLKNYYIKYSDKLFLDFKNEADSIISKIDKIENRDNIFNFFPSFPLVSSFFHPIEIIRGCPQACKYCQTSHIFGRKPRKKDLDIVKLFLRYQIKNKKNHIRFISPDFALYFGNNENLDFIKQWENLINFIKDEGEKNNLQTFIYLGSFPSELSLRYIKYEYLDLISKYSATKKITIGIQTASKRLQKIIGRNDPLDSIEDILKYCQKIGLEPIIDIIFGLPYETYEDRDITFSFLEKNCSKQITANLHYFLPIAGTDFAEKLPTKLSLKEIIRAKKLISKGVALGNFFKQMNEFQQRIEVPTQYLQNL
jgi:radical SAM superfamily enzyme YgiQ (UPF0313 family)